MTLTSMEDPRSFRFTRKQRAILEAIHRGSPDGGFIDLDELLEMLPYETTKPALLCSLRVLKGRHLVEQKPYEVRRGKRRSIYALRPVAYPLVTPVEFPEGVLAEELAKSR